MADNKKNLYKYIIINKRYGGYFKLPKKFLEWNETLNNKLTIKRFTDYTQKNEFRENLCQYIIEFNKQFNHGEVGPMEDWMENDDYLRNIHYSLKFVNNMLERTTLSVERILSHLDFNIIESDEKGGIEDIEIIS